jgi:RNase H-like domain found in reverse transcriptase
LITVLDQLLQFNVKVNVQKCKFFEEKVVYLGHEISKFGVAPNQKKVEAIVAAPPPTNVTELQSFIGLVNFYSKFIPHLLSGFYKLLGKGIPWNWSKIAKRRLNTSKKPSSVVKYYDPKKEIVVVCDASDTGLSGILCHLVDGVEKPFFFCSRTLSKAEKKR